ncbi:MAG: DNA polymerase IV [Rhodospirillaceae bacterium]|nr:DNA polymerase IV [Rhodospirillaceae bacterium]
MSGAVRENSLCRDCGRFAPEAAWGQRCPDCGSPRLVRHGELAALTIAHIDCDAFYASIEKRDRPDLKDRPVLVGGRRRGVVMAACYVARLYGVRSAMPMFKALRLCPEAVVVPPDMAKYRAEGRRIRAILESATPLVEAVSIDEAYLDLAGTERLHHGPPARALALLARRIEREVGVTVSVGLSFNKLLAKIASDLDKPRGFAVIGRGEALAFLAARPVTAVPGVGRSFAARLAADGFHRLGDVQAAGEADLAARYGTGGSRLWRLARGEDPRPVDPDAPARSISAETTLDSDTGDAEALLRTLWPLCEEVSGRLKRSGLAATGITLKLKTAGRYGAEGFRVLTRSRRVGTPTQLAEVLYATARPLLLAEANGRAFRLIGIGASGLTDGAEADPPDLVDPQVTKRALMERAIDEIRARLGPGAIGRGRGWAGAATKRRRPADRG